MIETMAAILPEETSRVVKNGIYYYGECTCGWGTSNFFSLRICEDTVKYHKRGCDPEWLMWLKVKWND